MPLMEAGNHVAGGVKQVAGLRDGLGRSVYSGCLQKDWKQTCLVRSCQY